VHGDNPHRRATVVYHDGSQLSAHIRVIGRRTAACIAQSAAAATAPAEPVAAFSDRSTRKLPYRTSLSSSGGAAFL